jgi:hypothetical protein
LAANQRRSLSSRRPGPHAKDDRPADRWSICVEVSMPLSEGLQSACLPCLQRHNVEVGLGLTSSTAGSYHTRRDNVMTSLFFFFQGKSWPKSNFGVLQIQTPKVNPENVPAFSYGPHPTCSVRRTPISHSHVYVVFLCMSFVQNRAKLLGSSSVAILAAVRPSSGWCCFTVSSTLPQRADLVTLAVVRIFYARR